MVRDGNYYNLNIKQTITRSTVSEPIFPRSGSRISLSVQFTLPYSAFTTEITQALRLRRKFKWLEYHKWRLDAEWYTKLVGNLVLKAEAKIGILGSYNDDIGVAPFERFQLGGDGFANQQFGGFTGVDLISLRGYDETDLEANRKTGLQHRSGYASL